MTLLWYSAILDVNNLLIL